MMVLLAGFTACGDDDDSNVAYFEKNRDYIREKKAQDSLFYQEMFHSEKLRIRKDDVEKTRQYLKEREH